ncbi:transcriptional regulator protein [Arthrobacter sp. Hiyo4]|nr:transcriptional regulator protein [Arthrobacter sp. Hiyo4]
MISDADHTAEPALSPADLPAEAAVLPADSRSRILAVAYELFARRGVRDVGVNELIERSGVAKATFYRHFPSKDALVLAFLEQRDQLWTVDSIVGQAKLRGTTPTEQLLAIFDVFGDWFLRDDFEACSFINILLEMGPAIPWARPASTTWPGSGAMCRTSLSRQGWTAPRISPALGTS